MLIYQRVIDILMSTILSNLPMSTVEAQRWPRLHGDDEDDALRRLPAAALRPGEGTLWSALERGHGTKSSDFPG